MYRVEGRYYTEMRRSIYEQTLCHALLERLKKSTINPPAPDSFWEANSRLYWPLADRTRGLRVIDDEEFRI